MFTQPPFRTLKTYKPLPVHDALGDWMYEVIEGRETAREQTFATTFKDRTQATESSAQFSSTIANLIIQDERTHHLWRVFIIDTWAKIEAWREKTHMDMVSMAYPAIFTVRWMKRDGLIYWSFYVNATTAGLAIDVQTGDVMSQRDEIDDDLEVFSMTYKPRK